MGDTLREIVALPGADKDIVNRLQSGELVPVEILGPILQSRVEKALRNGYRKILVDGFPRCLDQAVAIEAMVSPLLMLVTSC